MPIVPGTKKLNKFTKELRGSFGRFKTDHSYQLYYLSTSIPIDDIEDLSTASELFGADKIEFEELIQRDIDHSRVRKIANEYLSQGQGRVIFFPPLLACVLLIGSDGSLIKQYSEINHEVILDGGNESILRTTWEKDGFQLDLPIADADSSERCVTWQGTDRYVYEFATSLKLNPKRAKLVVLDGQHRLEALRLLKKNPDQQAIVSGLEVPVCIVWAPEAIAAQVESENITQDFRELFVRVNSEPRKVSGHFITLLKDDSYSAMAVRRLADRWKAIEQPGSWCRLHLLEWNTREDERADVRTREFSITTVSIIAKVLDDHLFSAGAAPEVLRLDQSASKFAEIDSEFALDGLVDKTQKTKVDTLVKQHIDDILIPALDTLLRTPTPYARLETALGKAFNRLHEKVSENNSSFMGVKAVLAAYIYREDEIFEESTRGAYVDFKHWIETDPSDKIYLLAVFQQALLRFWLNLSAVLKPFGVDAKTCSSLAVAALEKLVFSQTDRYLGADRKYTRRTLWRNENVNFGSSWAKTAWADLVGTSLLRAEVRSEVICGIKKNIDVTSTQESEIESSLSALGRRYFSDYGARLQEELTKETRQSLVDFFGDEKAAQLQALKLSPNASDRKEFENAIRKKAEIRTKDALDELANQLKVTTESLLSNGDIG